MRLCTSPQRNSGNDDQDSPSGFPSSNSATIIRYAEGSRIPLQPVDDNKIEYFVSRNKPSSGIMNTFESASTETRVLEVRQNQST